MEEIDVSLSFVQEDEQNEFLDGDFKYENCPHCQRNFFVGKLKYHLKLCKPTNPMTKSPLKKTKRSYVLTAIEKGQQQIEPSQLHSVQSQQKYKKCQYCRATFPLSMLQRHSLKCNLKKSSEKNPQDINKLKSKTKIDFGLKKDLKEPLSALPRIRNSAREYKNTDRKFVSQEVKDLKSEYTVKIRQELSCFKKALQVQKIECQYCHRRFSKEASLRHIPICQKIKLQQMHQMALKKNSKFQLYKLTVPIKKSTLFRSKFLSNSNQKSEQLEIKTARIYEAQKQDQQKINNSSFMLRKQSRKEQIINDLKPLLIKKTENTQINIQAPQNSIEHKNEEIIPKQQMNMTFSKDLWGSNRGFGVSFDIQCQKKMEQNVPFSEQREQKIETLTENRFQSQRPDKSLEAKNQATDEVENEFLQVTVSKKNFFTEINFEDSQNILERKIDKNNIKQEAAAQKLAVKIELQDFNKKKEPVFSQEENEYLLEFQN